MMRSQITIANQFLKRLLDCKLPTEHTTTPFDRIEFDPAILEFFANSSATSKEFHQARADNRLKGFFDYYKQFLNFPAILSSTVKASLN
jgi:hypothetical protein